MPGFNFRLSDVECNDVFEYILDQGGCLIPDELYPNCQPIYIRTKEEFYNFKETQISLKFFLIKDDYVEAPFKWSTIIKEGREVSIIQDRCGGPHIILLWFPMVNQGTCYYYPYYFNEWVEYRKSRPSELMIQFYTAIFSYVRKKSVIIKYDGARVYCGNEYLAQVQDGTIKKIEDEFKDIVLKYFKMQI